MNKYQPVINREYVACFFCLAIFIVLQSAYYFYVGTNMALNKVFLNKVSLKSIYDRYTYTTGDTLAECLADGYFEGAPFDLTSPTNPIVEIDAIDGDTITAIRLSDYVAVGVPLEILGMPAVADVAASIDNQGVTPTSRTGDGVSSALTAARAAGKALVLSHGVYEISSTLVLQSNDKIQINPSATLKASASFSGSSLIQVGNTADTAFTENVSLSGGGNIDADEKASRGIFFASARFSAVKDLNIFNVTGKPVYVGNNASVLTCYEINIDSVNVYHSESQNSSSSIGILVENATDCYLTKSIVRGYRRGLEVASTSSSIEASMIHCWAREVHGAMERGFSIFGATTAVQCNADSPFNLISGVGDLYGWYVSGNLMGTQLRVFMNLSTNHESNDRIWPYYFNGDSESIITLAKVHGGSPTYKFKGFAGGDTTNNLIINKITGSAANYVIAP